MKIVNRISEILYRVTGVWITGSLFVIVILAFVQVVSRYVFKFSIQWSQELIIYMMMWLVFLGCSMGLRDHDVASLTILTNKLSPRGKLIMEIIVDLLLVVFFIVSIIANNELIRLSNFRKSSIMRINMAFMTTAFSVGMGLSCLYTVIEVVKDFIKLFEKPAGGEGTA